MEKTGNPAVLYLPKSRLLGKRFLPQTALVNSKKVWTSFLYPFQIIKNISADQITNVHIQLEINTFGHPITLLLFPLLLFLLKVEKISTTITLHAVIPRNLKISNIPPFFSVFLALFYRIAEMFSTKIFVHSRVFQEWLVDYGLDKRKIIVIHHGVQANYSARPNRAVCDEKVILCFGVLSPRKGLEYLIHAFKIVNDKRPEVKLMIAGFEPTYFRGYKESLVKLVRLLNLEKNVCFTGAVPEEHIEKTFSMSDVVILPYNYSISASGPLTIALQFSKPIIATNTAFFRSELTSGENCLLVKSNDFNALASAIIFLLEKKQIRDKISSGAGKLANEYSWEKVAERTVPLYQF